MMLKMSVSFITAILGLLCVRHVTSDCPPDSGIYLMYDGDCYPNGSYFRDAAITVPTLSSAFPNTDSLLCILPNSTLNGGEWTRTTNGLGTVNCTISIDKDYLKCNKTISPASLAIYRPGTTLINRDEDQLYKCCLPTSCSDPSTNVITAYIFAGTQIANFSVELPPDITTLPQQLTLHCITIGDGYYTISFNYNNQQITISPCLHHDDTDCKDSRQLLHSSNYTFDNNITLTWDTETITNETSFNQSSNGDQMYKCHIQSYRVHRESTIIVKVPSFTPSSITVVNKTATTITVSWMANLTDADGYVVNATSDTAGTVTQQVEGGSQNTTTLRGLTGGTTYVISVRAYQDILGPAGSTISVQTLSVLSLTRSIIQLQNIQYRIDCNSIDVNVTDVHWLVNGVMKNSSMYTKVDEVMYIISLLVYPEPLGESINVTCIAIYEGVYYSDTVILQAPNDPPLNVTVYILNETSIEINWASESEVNGYIINFIDSTGANNIYFTTEMKALIAKLKMTEMYTISLYSYIDILSRNFTRQFKFNYPTLTPNINIINISTTEITFGLKFYQEDTYITYFNITYTPSCPGLATVIDIVYLVSNGELPVHTLKSLHSGMNYLFRVRAGNSLGESNELIKLYSTKQTAPFGAPIAISSLVYNETSIKITWDEINCTQSNGRIIEYIVMISNDTITYNLSTTNRYITVDSHTLTGMHYINVLGSNTIGKGPFSATIRIVGTLSSIMGTTWAVISWTVPSYIPESFPIITYEIGYHMLSLEDAASYDVLSIASRLDKFFNVSKFNSSAVVSNLTAGTYYVFGVRSYTIDDINGEWMILASKTNIDGTMPLCTSGPYKIMGILFLVLTIPQLAVCITLSSIIVKRKFVNLTENENEATCASSIDDSKQVFYERSGSAGAVTTDWDSGSSSQEDDDHSIELAEGIDDISPNSEIHNDNYKTTGSEITIKHRKPPN